MELPLMVSRTLPGTVSELPALSIVRLLVKPEMSSVTTEAAPCLQFPIVTSTPLGTPVGHQPFALLQFPGPPTQTDCPWPNETRNRVSRNHKTKNLCHFIASSLARDGLQPSAAVGVPSS